MRTTIDKAGRVVIPKPLRDELCLTPGLELEPAVVDGHLELALLSRVHVEAAPDGVRFGALVPRDRLSRVRAEGFEPPRS